MNADYHTHTNHSDGKLSPVELMKWAKENEISIIAVTDHDVVSGVNEAKIAGEALDIDVVPGVELTANFEGVQVHILGYHIDIENEELLAYCDRAIAFRNERNERMIKELIADGLLTEAEVQEVYASGVGAYIGKPMIARKLVEKNLYEDVSEVFDILFKSEKYRKIKKEKQSADRAIKAILAAGGIPVWAHPGKARLPVKGDREEFWKEAYRVAREMKKSGLKGIEAIHPSHSEEDRMAAINIAEKLHLHITEGSDYHGD